MNDSRVQSAERIMSDFAVRTGICAGGGAGGGAAQRYLWTDAFAVFALLEIHQRTGAVRYKDWALRLVDLVHHALGRHREDDHRSGWISGLSEQEGECRPTVGGLRIGKRLPERAQGEPYDERLEWQRDGQYFHYLTKWMHALNRVSGVTGDPRYNSWAIDLAIAAHRAFTCLPNHRESRRMHWKMSIDLSRPLIPSMGQLDPLDGLVAFGLLQTAQDDSKRDLSHAIDDMRRLCHIVGTWTTADPLGIGGLLTETAGLVQLIASGLLPDDILLNRLLADAEPSLDSYVSSCQLVAPYESRLAFRELGMSIGLHALDPMRAAISRHPDRFGGARRAEPLLASIETLARFVPLIAQIERTWLTPAAQASRVWADHQDINAVMLATSLVPEVYLGLNSLGRSDESNDGSRHSKEVSR